MVVLVAYASAHGSAREIAERVAARLGERGIRVVVVSADEASDAGGYDAIVLGSAIHDRAWLPEAAAYVDANVAALADRPVWLFSVGMPGALAGRWQGVAEKEGPAVVARFRDAVRPRDHRLFSGAVRREHLPRSGRLAFRALGGRYGDFRDWDEIDAWADGIAGDLAASPDRPGAEP